MLAISTKALDEDQLFLNLNPLFDSILFPQHVLFDDWTICLLSIYFPALCCFHLGVSRSGFQSFMIRLLYSWLYVDLRTLKLLEQK